ncbi:MAG: penicillin acylase family protein [Bacteroidota bacterium]
MRIIRKIALILLLLVSLSAASVFLYLQSTKPDYNGELKLKGLKAPVKVYHDNYGVPHISGSNEPDVYRAFGYLVAQERLFQMEMIRRVSSGRLSEILGGSMVDIDRFFRMLDVNAHADSSVARFERLHGTPCYETVQAYLDGINQFIEKGHTPIEFQLIGIPKEKYALRDLFLVIDYMSFNFQMGFRTDPLLSRIGKKAGDERLKDLVLGYTPDQLRTKNHPSNSASSEKPEFATIIEKMPVRIWTGSNAFAIAPRRSKSGKSLLENDTHIGHQQPGVWFEAHLTYPGFDFYGSYLAGFPFAPLGHSESFAWGVTMLENDDVDFFEEKTVPNDSNILIIKGKEEHLKIRKELIKVKDSADVKILCRTGPHGPICSDFMSDFSEFTSSPVSVSWTLLHFPSNLFEVTYGLDKSRSMQDFRRHIGEITSPGLNVVYTDTAGNIAWYAAARLVKRNPSCSTSLLMDGSDSTNEWLGFYDFSDNPYSENPPEGYVYSCNHQPDTFNGIFHPGYYLTDERARRLKYLLDEKEKFDTTDLKRISLDVTNPFIVQITAQLLQCTDPSVFQENEASKEAVRLLKKWNGRHQGEDRAPVIYYMWLYKTLRMAMLDEIGEKDLEAFLKTHTVKYSTLPLLKNDSSSWWDDINTAPKESRKEIVTRAFQETIKDISLQFTTDSKNWTWNKMHLLEFVHPIGKMKPFDRIFNVGPFPTDGGMETIDNQSFLLTDKFPVKVLFGPSMRRCIDFSDPLNAANILPSGQSGNMMSEHYDDQSRMYSEGKFRKDQMNHEEIKRTSKNVLTFLPE